MASAAELAIILTAKDAASGVLGNIGKALLGIGAAGVAGFGLAVKAAADYEKVAAQTEAVIKSTGGAAGLTAQDVADLGNRFQDLTAYTNDAVQSAENILLTFTSIGKDIFPQATETVLNMATALGSDAKESAIQLGKALNDPITGAASLRRVGVSLTQQQTEQIKVLQESGNLLGAQKIILNELATEFGGTAVAAGQTFAGQVEHAKNAIGDVFKVIGQSLLPVLTDLARSAAGAFTWLQNSGYLQSFIDGMKQAVAIIGELFGVVTGSAPYAGAALSKAVGHEAASAIMSGLAFIREMFRAVFAGDIPHILDLLAEKVRSVASWLVDFLRAEGPKIAAQLLEWGKQFAQWAIEAIPPMIARLGELLLQALNWIGDHSEDIGKVLGEWAVKFGEFAVAAAILLAQHLPEILFTLAKWAATEAIPAVMRIFANLAKGMIEGIMSGLGGLKDAIWQALVDAFRSIDFTVGPFHISGATGISITGLNLSGLPGFASGGIVPGALGAPSLAIVHGGERILPASQGGGPMVGQIVIHGDVDSEARVQQLAERIGQAVYRQYRAAGGSVT